MERRPTMKGFHAAAICCFAFSQDKPDGFAAISGKGLNTATAGAGPLRIGQYHRSIGKSR